LASVLFARKGEGRPFPQGSTEKERNAKVMAKLHFPITPPRGGEKGEEEGTAWINLALLFPKKAKSGERGVSCFGRPSSLKRGGGGEFSLSNRERRGEPRLSSEHHLLHRGRERRGEKRMSALSSLSGAEGKEGRTATCFLLPV